MPDYCWKLNYNSNFFITSFFEIILIDRKVNLESEFNENTFEITFIIKETFLGKKKLIMKLC